MNIVFSTFNARYSHTALALRCLRANLGELHSQSAIVEFEHTLSPQTAAEKLLALAPRIILFSVYIWNRTVIYETVLILKKLRPHLKIVIGGPEISHEGVDTLSVRLADHLVCGEGEPVIEKLCRDLLADQPLPKVIYSSPADLGIVTLPYGEYTDEDLAHRRLYVESSRGCPFKCEYCLSALENGVRFVPTERILPEFKTLIERGGRIFKFIDRSFNINNPHAAALLEFFLSNSCDGMMLHLEWEPEYLSETLVELLQSAPPGFFQLEVGVQTFNPEVAARVERKLNTEVIVRNIYTLAAMPSIHLHADLIAGLPGESLESIASGFDRLHACGPNEIQLGILKKLHGAPIARHDESWEMVYNSSPPYDVLQTSSLSFLELQAIRRFARFWDIIVNNGRFPTTAPMLWENQPSVFNAFMEWSNWLYDQTHATFGFTPGRLGRFLENYLTTQRNLAPQKVQRAIEADLSNRKNPTKGIERQTLSRQPQTTKPTP